MNKCTLVIDGNWLLMSRFATMSNLFDSNNSTCALNNAKDNLKDMLARSIYRVVQYFDVVDNIIIVADSGSWRKTIDVPTQLNDTTYKGNREHGNEISWGYVFGALDDMLEHCQREGITVCRETDIEGDDWCWYWSRYLNNHGVNCIIWSSDHDLIQLVQSTSCTSTIWFNETRGQSILYRDNTQEDKEPDPDDIDFFLQPITYKSPIIESIVRNVNKTLYINPHSVINEKIICGDSGDNIKSVARIVKNNRCYGVGKKEWNKIADSYNINTVYDLIDKIDDISAAISSIKKFNNTITPNDIKSMIEYNIKLVWLSEKVCPRGILSIMQGQEYKQADMEYIRGSYKTLIGDQSTKEIEDIFEL